MHLFGVSSNTYASNTCIFNATNWYILATKRFDAPLANPWVVWNINIFEYIRQYYCLQKQFGSAKLRALRTFVPHVPRALRALVPCFLVPHVPGVPRALLALVPPALRALVPYVPFALRALCLTCLVPNVLWCLTCLTCCCISRVLSVLGLLVAWTLRAPLLLVSHLLRVLQA